MYTIGSSGKFRYHISIHATSFKGAVWHIRPRVYFQKCIVEHLYVYTCASSSKSFQSHLSMLFLMNHAPLLFSLLRCRHFNANQRPTIMTLGIWISRLLVQQHGSCTFVLCESFHQDSVAMLCLNKERLAMGSSHPFSVSRN